MKEKFKIIVAVIVIIQLVLSSVTSSIALTTGDTGDNYSYIRTNNFDTLVDSTGEKVIYYDQFNFTQAPPAATADTTYKELLNLILFKPNATLSYQFDMRDDIQNAVFNLYGGNSNYKVEAKAEGESVYTTITTSGSSISATRGILSFNLTTTDALKSDNNKFIIKITNIGTSDGLLYAVSVNAFDKEVTSSIEVSPFTQSEMKYTFANNKIGRYHAGVMPSIQLMTKDSFVTYKFSLADDTTSLAFSAEKIGGDPVNLFFSSDGTNWTPLTGLSGDLTDNIAALTSKSFYIKCTSDTTSISTNLQAFLTKLTLTFGNIPNDNTVDTYQYIRTNTTAHLYASSGENQIYYDTSGYTGAPAAASASDAFKQLLNLILFKPNASLSFQFDLKNDVQNATLNIYGGNSSFKVDVLASGDSSYITLPAQGSIYGNSRGVISYNISSLNALKATNKKFVVRITNIGASDGVLYAVSANAFDTESSDSVIMSTFTESENKYTVSNSQVARYHNGDLAGIQFKTKDSFSVYKFSFINSLSSLIFNAETFGGDTLKLQYSSDATNWTPLTGLSGDLTGTIRSLHDKTFYIKCMSDPNTTNPIDNQAYLTNLTLTAGYEVVDNNVATYQYIRTNNFDSLIDSTGEKAIYYDTVFYTSAPPEATATNEFKQLLNVILFKPSTTLTYDFDLKNDVTDAVLNIYGGNSSFKVEVQAYGESTFTTLTAKGSTVSRGVISYGISTSDALKADNKKFVIRITNIGSQDGVLYALCANAFDKESLENIQVGAFTENELKYTYENNMVGRYHSGDIPNIQLKTKDSYVIYKFSLADNLSALYYTATKIGTDSILLEFSSDNSTWVPLAGLTGDITSNISGLLSKTFYIRCKSDPLTTNPTDNQAFLTSLSLQAIYDNAGGGIIGTPNGIGDANKYIRTNDLTKALSSSNVTISNDTRAGGYGILESDNLLHQADNDCLYIDNGGFVEYSFDLADSVNNATLKINGTGFSNVQVKAKDAPLYVNLFAKNSAIGPATFIFDLTNNDGLRNASKEFVVRIGGTTETVVQSIMVQTQLDEITTYNTLFKPSTETELKHIYDSTGLNRYFHNFTVPTIQMKPDSFLILKVDFEDKLNALAFNVAYANNSEAKFALSKDNGGTWIDVGSGVTGILDDYITDNADKKFLIKISPKGNADVFLINFSLQAEFEIVDGVTLPTIDFGYNDPLPDRKIGFTIGTIEEDPEPVESLVGGNEVKTEEETESTSSEESSSEGASSTDSNTNPANTTKPDTKSNNYIIYIIIAAVVGLLGVGTVLYFTKFKKRVRSSDDE